MPLEWLNMKRWRVLYNINSCDGPPSLSCTWPVNKMKWVICLVLLTLFSVSSCSVFRRGDVHPKREFRGVWIATVANIDWPEKGSDSWSKQRMDYLRLLDFYKNLNFNAVIVQIRDAGDALYDSEYAPWSRYLTGTEGAAPSTNTDPLQWMIREAHLRGFEFHAWLNPYRATFDLQTELLAPSHDFNTHPDWLFRYGNKYYYHPGLPEVQERLVTIMEEVVRRYEVDGIHFDDYFYPYKISGETIPDSLLYVQHANPGTNLEDWRRSNVDSLVKKVHKAIRKVKPWVQFGISPFGVWRNKTTDPDGSDTQAGQTTFDDLYADPLTWMQQGWIDYLIPQLYWSLDLQVASHRTLVAWWAAHSNQTKLYIGNAAYKIRDNQDNAWKRKKELPDQLKLSRQFPEVKGNALFSAKSLLNRHSDITNYIKKKYYTYPALPPEFFPETGLPTKPPEVVVNTRGPDYWEFALHPSQSEQFRFVLVYASRKKQQLTDQCPQRLIAKIYLYGRNQFTLGNHLIGKNKYLALSFLDRFGVETESVVLNLPNLTGVPESH